jgi:hypothetical protein
VKRETLKIFVEKISWKNLCRREVNITLKIAEIGREYVDWIHVAHGRVQWGTD